MVFMTPSGTSALNFYIPVISMSRTCLDAYLSFRGAFSLIKLAASLSSAYNIVRIGGNRLWLVVLPNVCSTGVALLILKICLRNFKARTLDEGDVKMSLESLCE